MKGKKSICIILLFLILSHVLNIKAYACSNDDNEDTIYIQEKNGEDILLKEVLNSNFKVNARCAIAIDDSSNKVLFEQNGYEIVPMASTTKILTCLIGINYGNLDEEVEISKNAASIRGSKVGYTAGEKIKMKELLFGLMFKSGNDAAIAIAEKIGGSVEEFSNVMNSYARSLGLVSSHFETPHGLDKEKHYTTAYDLAILTSVAMKNDLFREICSSKNISKDKYGFTRDYQNINKILWKIPNANGVKTGYTGQAGKCLVSSINYDGRNIIIVVLNCYDRWNETDRIFKYVEENSALDKISSSNIKYRVEAVQLGKIIKDKEMQLDTKSYYEDIEVFNNKLLSKA